MEAKLELIEYRDTNFDFADPEWVEHPDEDFVVAIVGWTKDTERWVIICSEITPTGERCITRIPRADIISRKRLKVRKSDSMSTLREEAQE